MYKWWALSLQEYAVVIFADLDVQIMRAEDSPDKISAIWYQWWLLRLAVPAANRYVQVRTHVAYSRA